MTEDKQIVNSTISSQQGTDDAQAIFDKGADFYRATQYPQALFCFQQIVDSYPSAAWFLGRMYEMGYGIGRDAEQSAAFYKKAALGFFHALADQGDAEAQSGLVSYYRAAQQYKEMLQIFKIMVEQGHSKIHSLTLFMNPSMQPLYRNFPNLNPLEQSPFEQGAALYSIPVYQEARKCFEPIARSCPPAALCLGLMYEQAQGVTKSSVRAMIHYKTAAAGFAQQLTKQKIYKIPYGLDQYYATQQLGSTVSSSASQMPIHTDQPGMVAVSTVLAPPIEVTGDSVLPAEISSSAPAENKGEVPSDTSLSSSAKVSAASNQDTQAVEQESLEAVNALPSSEGQAKDSKSGQPTLLLRPKADYKTSQKTFAEGLALYCQAEYSQALARFEQVNWERFPVVCIYLSFLYQGIEGVSHGMQKSVYWFEEAKKYLGWFQQIEKKRQKTAEDYYYLGLYYQFLAGKDKRKQAVDCYKNAVKFISAEANYRLGMYYIEKKNAAEARIYLEKAAAQNHKPAIAALEKLLQENPQLLSSSTVSNSTNIGVSSSHDIDPADQNVAISSSSIDNAAELDHETTQTIQTIVEPNLQKSDETLRQQPDGQDLAVAVSGSIPDDIGLPSQADAEIVSESESTPVIAETKVIEPAVSTKPKKPEDHFNEGFGLYQQGELQKALLSFLLADKGGYPSSYPFLCALYAGGPNSAEHDSDKSKEYGGKAEQDWIAALVKTSRSQ